MNRSSKIIEALRGDPEIDSNLKFTLNRVAYE